MCCSYWQWIVSNYLTAGIERKAKQNNNSWALSQKQIHHNHSEEEILDCRFFWQLIQSTMSVLCLLNMDPFTANLCEETPGISPDRSSMSHTPSCYWYSRAQQLDRRQTFELNTGIKPLGQQKTAVHRQHLVSPTALSSKLYFQSGPRDEALCSPEWKKRWCLFFKFYVHCSCAG